MLIYIHSDNDRTCRYDPDTKTWKFIPRNTEYERICKKEHPKVI